MWPLHTCKPLSYTEWYARWLCGYLSDDNHQVNQIWYKYLCLPVARLQDRRCYKSAQVFVSYLEKRLHRSSSCQQYQIYQQHSLYNCKKYDQFLNVYVGTLALRLWIGPRMCNTSALLLHLSRHSQYTYAGHEYFLQWQLKYVYELWFIIITWLLYVPSVYCNDVVSKW